MIKVGTFAKVDSWAPVKLVTQGISMDTIPLIPEGSMSAACSGKKPDSECPINTAPCSWTASAAIFFQVGFGDGSKALRSGIICLYSSSTASMGNCPSGKGVLNFGPNRKTDHAIWWLAVITFGS